MFQSEAKDRVRDWICSGKSLLTLTDEHYLDILHFVKNGGKKVVGVNKDYLGGLILDGVDVSLVQSQFLTYIKKFENLPFNSIFCDLMCTVRLNLEECVKELIRRSSPGTKIAVTFCKIHRGGPSGFHKTQTFKLCEGDSKANKELYFKDNGCKVIEPFLHNTASELSKKIVVHKTEDYRNGNRSLPMGAVLFSIK